MPRKLATKLLAIAMVMAVSACGARLPETDLLVDNVVVGALAPLPQGGVVYADRYTGDIYEATAKSTTKDVNDAKKEADTQTRKVGHVDVSKGGQRGVLGLAVLEQRRFVSYTEAGSDDMVVAELGDANRVLWRGPKAAETNLGGRLAFSPLGRLVISVGDLQLPGTVNDEKTSNGKILSLDPDRSSTQQANVISRGWHDPLGIAFDRSGKLWVADGDRLARAGENGVDGDVADLGDNVHASGLTLFADKELIVCERANKQLERYLIVDGVKVAPGRTVAENCSYDVVQQKGGTIAYATDSTIRTS